MKGSVSQMVALTAHANAHLQGHRIAFGLDHPAATICQSIEFARLPPSGSFRKRTVLARDPESWFDYLVKSGVDHLRLHYCHSSEELSSDRSTAAFSGGGGYWFIETVGTTGSALWESAWDAKSPGGTRIWKVWYILSRVRPDELHDLPSSPEDARKELHDALLDIALFAEKQVDTKDWVSWFQRALDALDSESDDWTRIILPSACYTVGAQQLIAASSTSSVSMRNSRRSMTQFPTGCTMPSVERLSLR
jgi:hypothetical protein